MESTRRALELGLNDRIRERLAVETGDRFRDVYKKVGKMNTRFSRLEGKLDAQFPSRSAGSGRASSSSSTSTNRSTRNNPLATFNTGEYLGITDNTAERGNGSWTFERRI